MKHFLILDSEKRPDKPRSGKTKAGYEGFYCTDFDNYLDYTSHIILGYDKISQFRKINMSLQKQLM
jgi:hypothetical protein